MMTTTQELLESSFELNLNNYGPEDVERLNDWAINAYAALEALQAEVVRLTTSCTTELDKLSQRNYGLRKENERLTKDYNTIRFAAGGIAKVVEQRRAALARLAEIENQEPAYLLTPDGKCYAYGSAQPLSAGHADATLLKLYAAAGASPVEPNFCESCAMDLSTCDCVTPRPVFVNQLPSAQPSQALSLDLLERLSKTLTRLGYATPEGGMEHFNADLANQLYNLCRAVDSLFDREQPPAPCDAAREYMTGYSDGKEWAQTSQAVELDYEKKLDIVSNWFSDEGMQSRAMQMLGDIEQAIAAAPQPKEPK